MDLITPRQELRKIEKELCKVGAEYRNLLERQNELRMAFEADLREAAIQQIAENLADKIDKQVARWELEDSRNDV